MSAVPSRQAVEALERAAAWAQARRENLRKITPSTMLGRVGQVLGTLVEGRVPNVQLGELCELVRPDRPDEAILAEVVGFTEQSVLLSALNPLDGVSNRTLIRPLGCAHSVSAGRGLFGKVLDGFGRVLFTAPNCRVEHQGDGSMKTVPVVRDAPDPTKRPRVVEPMYTGVRAIDTLLTVGYGQRIGVLAGPGCGKTTLFAAIARGAQVDAIVFGLIGERGRELKEFLDHELDEELVSKSIIVCSTSDRTSMERSRAAFTATAIAESLRDQGMRVLLLIDSLTRFARAQREIGLAAGEPPTRGGFPPSVYTMLPRLIERAGNTEEGSITAMYTVLVEGDSPSGDPVADEAKSLLDGHIFLNRKLAEQGHFPAIDVLMSISRTMSNVMSKEHMKDAARFRELLARYKELELLIRLGEYKKGADPVSDRAVEAYPEMIAFLRQDTSRPTPAEESIAKLQAISRA